jgi:NhaP-type Na+/H+ or K+/H+ antiporter
MEVSAVQSLALAFGVGALVASIAARLRVPAVLPLMAAGVALGPFGLGLVELSSVGEIFRAIVALAIGLLVFEGGLHLDRSELMRAPRAVLGLLTIGALVTAIGTAVAARLLIGMEWPLAVVLGSLVVVTGPTVIQPILRAVRLVPRLRSVLASEAILIDPIGVIGAVATLEIVLALGRGAADGSWQSILLELSGPFIGGTIVGVAVAAAGVLLLRALGARANLNVAGFALCMIAVGAGESLAHEGGLVAATVAGTILSNLQVVKTSDLREFKEQIASILVGMLFVLLASSFDLDALRALSGRDLALVAVILLVVRPLSVGIATLGSALDWRERLFTSLFAPRGVVATAVATLTTRELALAFADDSAVSEGATRVGLLVVLLVIVSVTWATLAAWPMAKLLGVLLGPPRGVLVAGAHAAGCALARALARRGIPVTLVDSNPARCEAATRGGLTAIHADATDAAAVGGIVRDHEIGWVLAWTGNSDVDKVLARWAREALGPERTTLRIPADLAAEEPLEGGPGRSARMRELDERFAQGAGAFTESAEGAEETTALFVRGDRVVALAPSSRRPRGSTALSLARAVATAPATEQGPVADAAAVDGAAPPLG